MTEKKHQARVAMLTPWVRMHTAPRICDRGGSLVMTAKQKSYYERSLRRYLQTADGIYLGDFVADMPAEIGRYESVRIIKSI